MSRFLHLFSACAVMTVFIAPQASAQADPSALPVKNRNYEGYTPKGLQLGSFLLESETSLKTIYKDNIYFAPQNEESDSAAALSSHIRAESDWSRHGIAAEIAGQATRYAENSEEDQNNGFAALEAMLDLFSGFRSVIRASYKLDHEARQENINTTTPLSPFRVQDSTLSVNNFYNAGRFEYFLGLNYIEKRFSNERQLLNPALITVREDADRNVTDATLGLAYIVHDDLRARLSLNYKHLNYLKASFDPVGGTFSGPYEDLKSYKVLAGFEGNLFRNVSGRVMFGLEQRDYADNAVEDITDQLSEISLEWNPSPLGTLRLGYNRTIQEDNEISGGFLTNLFSLGYDHELRRNVIASLGGSYEMRDYESVVREDDTYNFNAGLYYLLNQNYRIGFETGYASRESTAANSDYDALTLMLNLQHEF